MTTDISPKLAQTITQSRPYPEIGWVNEVVGLIVETTGPVAKVGDICQIELNDGSNQRIEAEVVGFKPGKLLLMPYGDITALSPGCKVINTGRPCQVGVGPHLLGRIIDPFGRPLDQRSKPPTDAYAPMDAVAPEPMARPLIEEPLALGIRAIDGLITVGRGQRLGIFAGSGVGKSTLMGMMCRQATADINVIALVGERGREVREFVEQNLGPEGLARSVVVVATSEQPPLMKIKAALAATAIAEYFRDSGRDVLLMMDSLTRVAMALREVGLSVGEPPTSRGYTPSVFTFLPRLLERSGTTQAGSITGLYTVLVEGDDFNEPISDAVRGILDGHIALSRALAQQNHFPSIDVLESISRCMVNITRPEHQRAAGLVRDALATYRESEDLINIGAYVRGTNTALDKAIQVKKAVDAFLKQEQQEYSDFADIVDQLLKFGQQLQ
ncbi:MAG: FliI/YscN family ATPase [Cyanobacteria bacterium HKST-UBA04]|nr:FliI/YscN family ATPase [Cyanobacteria bacterium HKST-UBA04]